MKRFFLVWAGLMLASCLFLSAQNSGNKDFDSILKLAETQFQREQYERARSTLTSAKKNTVGISESQKREADRLIARCDIAIAAKKHLSLSVDTVRASFDGTIDTIGVKAGQKNKLKASLQTKEWGRLEDVSDDTIRIRVFPNTERQARRTVLTVTMGDATLSIPIIQEGRPETRKHVVINTTPDFAKISVDGGNQNNAPWDHPLLAGSHRIRIEKQGYFPIDTVLVLADDLREELLKFNFSLKPQFGTISVNITPEPGFFMNSDPVLSLNGNVVDRSPRELYTFDDDRNILTYTVYKDGLIPVYPGKVSISVSADNFETVKLEQYIKEGEHLTVPVTLKAETGSMSLIDAGNARDAVVYLDGREIGPVERITGFRAQTGKHNLSFKKDGFLTREASYPVEIRNNQDTTLRVSMDPFVVFYFSSKPTDARVYVDEEYIGNTPTRPYTMLRKDDNEPIHVVFSKANYASIEKDYLPDFMHEDTLRIHFDLARTHPLRIVSDEDGLILTLRNRRGGDSVFVKNIPLPAEVDLPFRKGSYWVELERGNHRAYRGPLRFHDEKKTRHKIMSWSKNNFQLLDASYLVHGSNPFTIGEGKEYLKRGDLNFLKFKIFSGLSTSTVKGSLFMAENTNSLLTIPDVNGIIAVKDKLVQYLPGISCMFINGDFRIGGAILDFLDIDAMASYAWYPDVWSKFMNFSYISGHDLFLGGELSTRIPFLNVSVRAGMQMYPNLKATIYSGDYSQNNHFYEQNLKLPNMFVVSVGVSLGGKDSKGQNILRIF